MIEYKEILGILTVLLNIIAYIPYRKDMIKGTTVPHIFTWFIRGSGSLIVFAGQRMEGAGAGSWSNLFAGVICIAIAVYAFFHSGSKYITKSDWFFLCISIISLGLYFVTDDWFLSILLITIGEILSFIPTIRKSWTYPWKETINMYRINAFKFILMIVATQIYTFVTVGNSIMRLCMNGGFALFLVVRRRMVKERDK